MTARAAPGAMIAGVIASRRQPAAEVQMSGRRWSIWLGPPVALLVVAVLLGQLQPRAEAGGRTTPPPAGACAGAAPMGAPVQGGARGAWWRLVDRLDGEGTLVGRTLFAGVTKAAALTMDLGVESMASGPKGGLVVVTSDDGRFSDVHLVSAARGCAWLVHHTESVVRSAILDASTGTILAHLVQRETRVDLGTWRIASADPGAAPALVLDALGPRPELGSIWATALLLDDAGETLAVQSCSDRGCLTRVASLGDFGRSTTFVEGPGQGSLIGLAGKRLITWAFCAGVPCSVVAWDAGGDHQVLFEGAAGAGLTAGGRYLVVVTDPARGRAFRLDLAGGGEAQQITGFGIGEVPLQAGASAYAGLEVAPNEVAIAAPGADARAIAPGDAAAP